MYMYDYIYNYDMMTLSQTFGHQPVTEIRQVKEPPVPVPEPQARHGAPPRDFHGVSGSMLDSMGFDGTNIWN